MCFQKTHHSIEAKFLISLFENVHCGYYPIETLHVIPSSIDLHFWFVTPYQILVLAHAHTSPQMDSLPMPKQDGFDYLF
jgi:hypothetical protein